MKRRRCYNKYTIGKEEENKSSESKNKWVEKDVTRALFFPSFVQSVVDHEECDNNIEREDELDE